MYKRMIRCVRLSAMAQASVFAIALLALLWSSSEAQAQAKNYEFFRTDSGLIGAYVPGTGSFGGGAVVEPKLNISDQLSLGLRTSVAITGGGKIEGNSGDVSVGLGISVGALAKGEYYFSTSSTRPFLGFGAGLYYLVSQDVDTGGGVSVSQSAGEYFGFAPQVGIQLGGFRLALTYNAMLGANYEVVQSVGGTKKVRQDFVTIDLAFLVKGGRKIAD